jgi:hypothetical protein
MSTAAPREHEILRGVVAMLGVALPYGLFKRTIDFIAGRKPGLVIGAGRLVMIPEDAAVHYNLAGLESASRGG